MLVRSLIHSSSVGEMWCGLTTSSLGAKGKCRPGANGAQRAAYGDMPSATSRQVRKSIGSVPNARWQVLRSELPRMELIWVTGFSWRHRSHIGSLHLLIAWERTMKTLKLFAPLSWIFYVKKIFKWSPQSLHASILHTVTVALFGPMAATRTVSADTSLWKKPGDIWGTGTFRLKLPA